MRTAALIIAAAALTLSACNRPAEEATEAAEASGAAADTAAASAEESAGEAASAASAARSSRSSPGGQTMDPAAGSTTTDGAMAPPAQPSAGDGTTITETQRRLNPPQNNQPAQ